MTEDDVLFINKASTLKLQQVHREKEEAVSRLCLVYFELLCQ